MDIPERLLDALEKTAASNTLLAGSVATLAGEVRLQGSQIAEHTTVMKAHTDELKRVLDAKDRAEAQRATLLGKMGAGLWGVVKTPATTVLMASAAWLVYHYLSVP